ncbi:hypothetical protein [Novosphingobium sp.]|uniref:hypothetical protein n=1 Tax=Novosphingobium sp. TaxID=1874826 RepID=UPI002B4618CB|nr:hypothetical protein [Novosphingobium sp.]HKR91873.1 hypothetical protein [Novosphingobium sp.]
MARSLHIERQKTDGGRSVITLDEWKAAVDQVDGVRMARGDAAATNPLTREIIVLPNRGGDAEVFRKDCDTWLRALFWTPGGIVRFIAPEMAEDPILPIAHRLAGELNARVCGAEGETYD